MKSVVTLWLALLNESGEQCAVRTHRDRAYALSRIEHEGLAFLTLTLPRFEDDFLSCLSSGRISSSHFQGFTLDNGGLPRFLSGFLRKVFDDSGCVRSDASPYVIQRIRQVLTFVKKIEIPCAPSRELAAFDQYITTDAELGTVDFGNLLSVFGNEFRRLFSRSMSRVEHDLYLGNWQPRHGPGAVAEKLSYNEKYSNNCWTTRLSAVFPWWDDLIPNYKWAGQPVRVLPPDTEPPVRVVTVPKTMKTPRIIAIEPTWMQYVQQGIGAVMEEHLVNHPLYGMFGHRSQEPNRALAREGSSSGALATLDLSEASDRVSNELVLAMLSRHGFLSQAVQACRSATADVNGDVVTLHKFASMGSALTFPIETLVFFTIISLVIRYAQDHGPADLFHSYWRDKVRVYGDDIIVPTPIAQVVSDALTLFGLKVNTRKSFTTGRFRESCGADWYNGVDVSVVKLRHPLPETTRHAGRVESAVALHQRLYAAGYESTAQVLGTNLSKLFPRIPVQPPGTNVPSIWVEGADSAVKFCNELHVPVYRTVFFKKTKPLDPLDGLGALRKFFIPHIMRDKDHLRRDGRSQFAAMQTGWRAELTTLL